MVQYPNKFQRYKNCNSLYKFIKINDEEYLIINKVRNWKRNFVKNFSCKIKSKNILGFLNYHCISYSKKC